MGFFVRLHELFRHILSKPYKDGETSTQIDFPTLIDDFKENNDDIKWITDNGIKIELLEDYNSEEILNVCLVISENDTHDRIRDAVSDALQIRSRLSKYKEEIGLDFTYTLLSEISRDQERFKKHGSAWYDNPFSWRGSGSYGKIAKALNQKVYKLICDDLDIKYIQSDKPSEYANSLNTLLLDFEDIKSPHPRYLATNILRTFGFSSPESEELINTIKESLLNNPGRYMEDFPIDRERVRNSLMSFQKRKIR